MGLKNSPLRLEYEEKVRELKSIPEKLSEHSYSWVMDVNGDDVAAGTIGAYDYNNGQIEVGFSVGRACQGCSSLIQRRMA